MPALPRHPRPSLRTGGGDAALPPPPNANIPPGFTRMPGFHTETQGLVPAGQQLRTEEKRPAAKRSEVKT